MAASRAARLRRAAAIEGLHYALRPADGFTCRLAAAAGLNRERGAGTDGLIHACAATDGFIDALRSTDSLNRRLRPADDFTCRLAAAAGLNRERGAGTDSLIHALRRPTLSLTPCAPPLA